MYARLHQKKCKFKDVEQKDKPLSAQMTNAEREARIKQHAKSVGMNLIKPTQGYNAEIDVELETTDGYVQRTRMVKA